MKVAVFNTVRGGVPRFQKSAARYDEIELVSFDCPPTIENLEKARGCESMILTPTKVYEENYWKHVADVGIKYVVTPSAGYDHFDLTRMKEVGIKASNVPVYSPNAIAEHAVLTLLALLRKYREQLQRIDKIDYSLDGLMGGEIRNQTIGIVGAGRIGYTTMKCLSGFGPKRILAYDPYQTDKVKQLAEYVSLDELYKQSDVIIYHCIYTPQNHHMVNKDAIEKMKDGVILINVARGGLFDIEAVANALERGKIAALGIDVIEGEELLRKSTDYEECPIKTLSDLLKNNNVIFTNHTAFYTDEAERNMVDTAMDSLHSFLTTGESELNLVR